MKYMIKTCIDSKSIEKLKFLKGNILNQLLISDAGEFALEVVLSYKNQCLSIKNIPSIQSDGDEYPLLVIEEFNGVIENLKSLTCESVINNIYILRDKVRWEYADKEWTVESDIAIKLELNDFVLFLVAVDSLAGFTKVLKIEKSQLNNTNLFDDFWAMKTDELLSIEHAEICL